MKHLYHFITSSRKKVNSKSKPAGSFMQHKRLLRTYLVFTSCSIDNNYHLILTFQFDFLLLKWFCLNNENEKMLEFPWFHDKLNQIRSYIFGSFDYILCIYVVNPRTEHAWNFSTKDPVVFKYLWLIFICLSIPIHIFCLAVL